MSKFKYVNTRVCTKCKKELDFSKFGKEPKGKFGLKSICKKCRIEHQNKYNLKIKEINMQRQITLVTKTCTKCNRELNINKFSKNIRTLDGINNRCKECTKQIRLEYRNKNIKNKILEYNIKKYKKCFSCNKIMDSSSFYHNFYNKTGLSTNCKECIKKKNSQYNKKI